MATMQQQGQQQNKQRFDIAVIGVGEEGSALIRMLTKLGHNVCMANEKGPESMKELANETKAKPEELREVTKDAQIMFLCIPMKDVPHLPKDLFDKCKPDCVIVDCCNYYPHRDGTVKELEDEKIPESMWVSKKIGKPVVKALNTVLAPVLEEMTRSSMGERIAVPISGDNPKHKQIVSQIVQEMGFEPFDAGSLENSWRQQPGSPAYCTNLNMSQIRQAMEQAKKDSLPMRREEAYRKMTSSSKQMNWREMVDMLRETYSEKQQSTEQTSSFGTKEKPTSTATSTGTQQHQIQADQPQT